MKFCIYIYLEKRQVRKNLYIKPSNLQLYLDYTWNHPQHCKIGIIYSQALRIIERCSRPENVYLYLENLKDKLKARNYPEERIEQHFEKAQKRSRQELINQYRKNKKNKLGLSCAKLRYKLTCWLS